MFLTRVLGLLVVQLLTCVRLFATPWNAACQASLSFIISQRWLKLISIESVMPSNHLCQQRHPLSSLLSCPQSFPVSETVLCSRWPKFWSFNINPSSEFSGLIFFRIDWFDLLAVHGTLKSLLQHHNLKASVLQHSSLLYGPTFTSVHDYWKIHSFDYMDLCQPGLCFLIRCLGLP